MPEDYKRKPNTKCVICGKAVYKRPAVIKTNSNNVYCSNACYGISCRKEKPCVVCGKPILAGLNKKTCSRGCANKHRTGIKYKMNSPKDKVKHYLALKTRLVKKRGGVCEVCDYNVVEILQIHHKDRNRNNNDLENLQLLCPNCHCKDHYLKKSGLKYT